MADATSQAQVVVTLEANIWSLRHLDIIVENAGTAPAYDVRVSFDPGLPADKIRHEKPFPFQNISLIRPGQTLTSYACQFAAVQGQAFVVTTSWKKAPSSKRREILKYEFDIKGFEGISVLGRRSAEIQMAEEIKRIREDWRAVAGGTRRLKVETFSHTDRQAEDEEWREWRQNQEKSEASD